MTVTIYDVAKEAKVSISTVSRVINNSPLVKEETRQRVKKVMQKLNYRPNVMARGLMLKKSHTIALILPNSHAPFFSEIIGGVEQVASNYGYNIIIGSDYREKKKQLSFVTFFAEGRIDGLIIMLPRFVGKDIQTLLNQPLPLVSLGSQVPGLDTSCVLIDNFGGAYEAVQFLINKGHKRIAFISGIFHTKDNTERLQGYKAALKDHGINLRPHYIARGDFLEESGRKTMAELLKVNPRPTAVFAANDNMAIGAMDIIKKSGLKIPDDIAIVGFDDIPLAAYTQPPLTTVRQPMLEMGKVAAEKLFKNINNIPDNQKIITLKTDLIIRKSA